MPKARQPAAHPSPPPATARAKTAEEDSGKSSLELLPASVVNAVAPEPLLDEKTPILKPAIPSEPLLDEKTPILKAAIPSEPLFDEKTPILKAAIPSEPLLDEKTPVLKAAASSEPLLDVNTPILKAAAPSSPPLERPPKPKAAPEPGPASKPPSASSPEPAFVGATRSTHSATRASDGSAQEEEVHAEPGSVFAQMGAGLIDAVVLGALFAAYLWAAQMIAGKIPSSSETGIDWVLERVLAWKGVLGPGAALLGALSFVYGSLFHALGGKTPGKWLFRLTVVDASGSPPKLARSVIRSLLAFVSMALLMMGFVLVLFDSKRQALHDKLTRTFVVRLSE